MILRNVEMSATILNTQIFKVKSHTNILHHPRKDILKNEIHNNQSQKNPLSSQQID